MCAKREGQGNLASHYCVTGPIGKEWDDLYTPTRHAMTQEKEREKRALAPVEYKR